MMAGPSLLEFILLLVMYPIVAILVGVTIGIGIALGFRWGGRWLLKAIYSDPQFERWLKRVLDPSDNESK